MNKSPDKACIVADEVGAPLWQRLFGQLAIGPCIKAQAQANQTALIIWAAKVMPHGDWDHKPKLRLQFPWPRGRGAYHLYGEKRYFYDIWSNAHFGYVGRAAGFSGSVLLDGAGLAQALDDILHGRGTTGFAEGRDRPAPVRWSQGRRVHQAWNRAVCRVPQLPFLAEVSQCGGHKPGDGDQGGTNWDPLGGSCDSVCSCWRCWCLPQRSSIGAISGLAGKK